MADSPFTPTVRNLTLSAPAPTNQLSTLPPLNPVQTDFMLAASPPVVFLSSQSGLGTAYDMTRRVVSLIPHRWFQFGAPLRDALLGGISDAAEWGYNLYLFTVQQSRIFTSTGPFLDLIAYDFLRRFLLRNGSSDDVFRAQILATILQERVTRNGMMNSVDNLVGVSPKIFEPWNTGDAGAYGVGSFAYGSAGAWGSLQLPGQAFLTISRAGLSASGIPGVEGYGGGIGGYNVGAIQYVSSELAEIGVTDPIIYTVINNTRPTGVLAWTRIGL